MYNLDGYFPVASDTQSRYNLAVCASCMLRDHIFLFSAKVNLVPLLAYFTRFDSRVSTTLALKNSNFSYI